MKRVKERDGSYYHVYRGTWRRLGRVGDPAVAQRHQQLEAIIEEGVEPKLDAVIRGWALPRARPRRGPRRSPKPRPHPVRMHAKSGALYHVYNNKWRRLGPMDDYQAALQRYHKIEREIVAPDRAADAPGPYPVRMHAKSGALYHVYNNKWRRLGPMDDYQAALRRYHKIEREIVAPDRAADAPASSGPERPEAAEPEQQHDPRVRARTPRSRYHGYYAGGTRHVIKKR